MLANKTDAAFLHVATGTGVGPPLWFPSLHVVPPRPNTANKIRLFVKQLIKISTFPVKAFWPSFAYHNCETLRRSADRRCKSLDLDPESRRRALPAT